MGDHVELVGITQMIETMVGSDNVYPFEGNWSTAPTGERYDGVYACATKSEYYAEHAFTGCIKEYVQSKPKGSVLYWRRKPYSILDEQTGKKTFSARLLVSDKSVVISHDRDAVSDEEFKRYKKESMKP